MSMILMHAYQGGDDATGPSACSYTLLLGSGNDAIFKISKSKDHLFTSKGYKTIDMSIGLTILEDAG